MAIALLTQLLVSGVNSFLPLFLVDEHGASQEMGGLMLGLVYGVRVMGPPRRRLRTNSAESPSSC